MDDVRSLPVGEDDQIAVTLDALAREGARRMIAAALKAEADDYVERFPMSAAGTASVFGRAQRSRPRAAGDGRVGHRGGPGAARE